jgi:hypothetical protein
MPYVIKHVTDLQIIEVTLAGVITAADLRKATTEAASIQKRTGAMRVLIDADGWEVAASAIEIYELPARQYWEEGVKRESRFAVIRPTSPSARQAAHNYEIMCQNRGWQARILPDRQTAMEWLIDGK